MGLLLESLTIELLCALLLLCWAFYRYLTRNYDYWEKRGVPYINTQFPFGSVRDIVLAKAIRGKVHDEFYKHFSKERFYGIIEVTKPVLVVRDPDLIKTILVKDFQYFKARGQVIGNPKEYIMRNLVNSVGQEWKDMRTKLTPTFSSGKIKMMFDLMENSCEQLKIVLDREFREGKLVDVKDVLSKFTMDLIASCAFGLDASVLKGDGEEFFRIVKGPPNTSKRLDFTRILGIAFPSLVIFLRLNKIRPELTDFLTNMVRSTVEYRKENDVKRKDFIDLLMNIRHDKVDGELNGNLDSKSSSKSHEGLSIEEMTAQAFIFYLAGFEAASSLMTFCLYELARNSKVQEKLHQEIQLAVSKNEGKISYQVLMEIPFLGQVINETLRLYGLNQMLGRRCTETYKMPDSDLVVEKGTKVLFPLFAIHHDPQYYPDPYQFKPERFAPEEFKKRHPFVFMPFGEGPRNCIGMRFALIETKVGLATILLNFEVSPPPDQEEQLEMDPQSILLIPIKPIQLKFSSRKAVTTED